jgi:hypothetical protein
VISSSEAIRRTVSATGKCGVVVAAPYRVPVYAACTVAAVALNLFLGKDMAWDALHYHFYAGFSALNDRFGQDYFAAGAQSYFNPYAYVPFYVLANSGLPGVAVSSVLALMHSVVLWLTYELACEVCPSKDSNDRFLFGLFAIVLACMNPVLLQQIGSSFADITTAEIVLAGWLLLARAVQRPNMKLVVFAAFLLGCATALKPTNAIHALAGVFLVAFLPSPFLYRIRSLFYFGATVGIGFVLTAAPWSYRLAKCFGNPMFPLLNNIFKSPEFTTAPLKHYRFIPDSLTDALLRPFTMLSTSSMVHEELTSPDIRYALLLSVSLILAIARIWQSIKRPASGREVASPHNAANRVLAGLAFAFAFDWVIWLLGSGNSRYFIPMACIAAVVAAGLLFRLLADHPVGRNCILLTLLVAQGAQLCLGAEFRWNPSPWEGHWFNVETPQKLVSQPDLYLSIGMQSNSFIVPFLAKGSGLINFSGGYALGPDGANASRVRAMIARSSPRLRVLVSGDRIYEDSRLLAPRRSDVDDALSTFGLLVDMKDCETFTVKGLRPTAWRPLGTTIPVPVEFDSKLRYSSHLVTCHLIADTRDKSQEMSARRAVDIVLDRLEDACPALFQPRRPQTEHVNQLWFRTYPSTDLTAWVARGEVKFVDAIRGDHQDIAVGTEEDWARAPVSLDCGRRRGIYFATLTQAKK